MNKDIIFKIIAVVFMIGLLFLLYLNYSEIKNNPCKDSSCADLFQHITDNECFKYKYPLEDIGVKSNE